MTAAEQACLAAVREATGTERSPMELHGERVHRIACELADRRGDTVDRELLHCAGYLHDLGLYPSVSRNGVYTRDGALFARELLSGLGWEEPRLTLCADAIERHHEVRPQWGRGVEVELLRRADLVEVSGDLIRFGVPRDFLRALNAEFPRDGFYSGVASLLGHALRERPLTLPRIFLR